MISLQSISLQRGTKILFDNASLTIFAKQKVGIVGVNGSGKSSLFSLILKELQLDGGELYLQSQIKIAYLSQAMPDSNESALRYTMYGNKKLGQLLIKLDEAEKNKDSVKIAELHHRLYEINGYAAEAKAAKILNGLGFLHHEHRKPVNEFSGGWRMRLNLAQVLMSESDLLLLDEPTNYLDLDAIIWLEMWLKEFEGTVLLISHDRDFLDGAVDYIAHVFDHKFTFYTGNYSSFEKERAEKLLLEQKLYEKQQAKISHMMKYVDRFRYKASKARQAQSRLKAVERMELVSVTHINSPFTFKFLEPKICQGNLLRFDQVDFSYGDNEVLKKVDFSIGPGDRIGVLGPNGAGKSTFLKLLCGNLFAQNGEISKNRALKIGYFAQNQVDQLNLNESAMFHIMQLGVATNEREVRNFLGGFNFPGDMVFNEVGTFSGGEKARLVLAMLVWQKPNLLLLDEPTNHLDLDMREALTFALQEYAGALIVVAHDRYLLKSTVDEFYLVYDHKISKFDGDIIDYQNWLCEKRTEQFSDLAKPAKSKSPIDKVSAKNSDKKIKQLEEKLNKLWQEKKLCEEHLAEPKLYQAENKKDLDQLVRQLKEIDSKIKLIEKEWLVQSE